jgi:acyl-[acyl-carrier-protein]-phospholipid O-acyltransferase/long-chain-fatty-acid--[acyl-carrier-protein] ligase
MPFRKGFDRIMKGVEAPIIPVHVDNIWGTLFRFVDGKFTWRWPDRVPFTITAGFGKPLPSESNAYELRAAIQELGTEAYTHPEPGFRLLHRRFVRKARLHPFGTLIADGRSGALSHIKSLAGSIILARKLKSILTRDEEMVGILLPQSVGGTLANIALMLMGKIPVNLNYTASEAAITAAAQQCKMKHVLTAHAFLEQMPVKVPADAVYMEDIMKSVEKKDRIAGLLLALFCPVKPLERSLGAPANRDANELATVVFSSGSEGEPKGVMLTHYNVAKNIESALLVFPHKKGDCIVGMLPFFHSFGFTATLWLVLTAPHFRAVFHPNPLEARAIGELIQKHKGTIMFSTSTFLHGFIRRCTPEQMVTLRHVICGAEKLAPRVRDAFKEKFGVEPLEGYGTTECAPIVSLNLPDVRAPGFYLKGTKRGSIGLPLPGISVRIIDPDTRAVLQNGAAGLLMVKGPNVMRGYLNKPDKTAQVLQDGWYETGDISTIDEDGFITITDRLARFSKIGGEMVSHTKIEDELHKVLNEAERKLAVAGVPDENKGERLVVLHTLTDAEFEDLMGKLGEIDLPNLWVPKPKAFYKVDEIPILGTGKMDLKAVKDLARKLDVGE